MKHTPPPWLVCIDEGHRIGILRHTSTGICLDRDLWGEMEPTIVDDRGYNQPDDNVDCSERLIADARLIAAAPILLQALKSLLFIATPMPRPLPGEYQCPEIVAAQKAIALAEGK